jgi:hypothetical protein
MGVQFKAHCYKFNEKHNDEDEYRAIVCLEEKTGNVFELKPLKCN